MNKRGAGSIFLRGPIYWIRYSHHGQEFRESSRSESESVARRFLKERLRETGRRGKFLGPAEDRLKFGDLAEIIRNEYAINGRRSGRRLEASLKQLRASFGLDRAVDITADRIAAYAVARRASGAANATINRELAALKRMFKIAVDNERLSRAPHISMLAEANVRQGFLEHAEFVALQEALPERLRDPIKFLYKSGWRVGEMRSLEWSDVDSAGTEIRLPPAKSKNKEGRFLPLTGDLADLIARARANRRLDCSLVFHSEGKPFLDFRVAWASACQAAGLGKLLVHDLRRTAVRNFDRARVSRSAAMKSRVTKPSRFIGAMRSCPMPTWFPLLNSGMCSSINCRPSAASSRWLAPPRIVRARKRDSLGLPVLRVVILARRKFVYPRRFCGSWRS